MNVDWPITLAFTKAFLNFAGAASWPAAAAGIAIAFKEPLSGAIGRAKRVSVFGVEADLPTQVTAQKDASIGALEHTSIEQLSVTPLPLEDEVLTPLDSAVRELIEKEPLNPEQKYAWAIRLAANFANTANNERIYRLAYGSQLKLLRQLNLVISMPLTLARDFFEQEKDRSVTLLNYNFEAWIGFLREMQVASIIEVSGDRHVQLTAKGRNFLLWMVQQRAVEEKPY